MSGQVPFSPNSCSCSPCHPSFREEIDFEMFGSGTPSCQVDLIGVR